MDMKIELQCTPAADVEGTELALSHVQLNLSAAREARKHSELEAQLLSNRIALLKQEERKSRKIIEQMRNRAHEITERRAEKEQEHAAKEEFYKARWESIRAAQTQNAYDRGKAKTLRDVTTKDRMDAKVASKQQIKQESHQLLSKKYDHEAEVRKANAQRSNRVKQQKEEAQQKLHADRHAQQEKVHADYCARVAREESLRACTEALIAKLEEEELECIQKLKNTETVRRDTCEKLDAVLGEKALPNLLQRRDAECKSGKEKGEPRPAA